MIITVALEGSLLLSVLGVGGGGGTPYMGQICATHKGFVFEGSNLK